MRPFIQAARTQYVASLSELVTTKEYTARVREVSKMLHDAIAKNFGEPLARRVTR